MRKIKVFSRIYKSLLVLCRKDPFQYIYFVIISITSSVLKTTKIQTIAKKIKLYKCDIHIGYITIKKKRGKEMCFGLILVRPRVASSCVNSGS